MISILNIILSVFLLQHGCYWYVKNACDTRLNLTPCQVIPLRNHSSDVRNHITSMQILENMFLEDYD